MTLSPDANAVAACFVHAFAELVELEKRDAAAATQIAEAFSDHIKSKFPMCWRERVARASTEAL